MYHLFFATFINNEVTSELSLALAYRRWNLKICSPSLSPPPPKKKKRNMTSPVECTMLNATINSLFLCKVHSWTEDR
jgi:hypothetical protein